METIVVWLSILDRMSLHRLYSTHLLSQKYCGYMIDDCGFCGMNAVIDIGGNECEEEIIPMRRGCLIDLFGSHVVTILNKPWVQDKSHFFLSWIDLVLRTQVSSLIVESIIQFLSTSTFQQTKNQSPCASALLPSFVLLHLVKALPPGSETSLRQRVVSQGISHAKYVATEEPLLTLMELDLLCQILLSFESLSFQEQWLEDLLEIQSHLTQYNESSVFLCVLQLLIELCDDFRIT